MKKRYIAVVEDDEEYRRTIGEYLDRYASEKGREFSLSFFANAKSFIEDYRPNYDLILMDIELPDGNGMSVVRKIRGIDPKVLVIFVTNMARYAVKGYEVEAFDFIVKPVTYPNFSVKLGRALERLDIHKNTDIWVNTKGGKCRIRLDKLKYVEVMKHNVVYHTTEGDVVTIGSMKNAVEQLKDEPFELCNRCYLVNLAFVEEIKQFQIVVGGEELLMSHLKRADFLKKLNRYLSGDFCNGDH